MGAPAPRALRRVPVNARLIASVLVLLPAVGALTGWVAYRAAEALGLGPRGRRGAMAIVWLALLTPFVLRLTDTLDHGAWAATVGFGVAFACLLAFAPIALVQALDALARRAVPDRTPPRDRAPTQNHTSDDTPSHLVGTATEGAAPLAPLPEPISRREVLRRSGVSASVMIGSAATGYGMTFGRHDYALEEVPIRLARLPRTLDGYTIAQLSDLHVGTFVGDPELRAAEALVRRARPDLIVLTGDLIDHDVRAAPRLGAFVRRLAELGVRDGVVAIPGNHDYYAGVDEVIATLRASGARVLRNDGVLVPDGERASAATTTHGFSLLGADDVWARRYGDTGGADLPRTLGFAAPDLARVLLCHNPELFPEAAGQVDLQLSGHTHGGQVTFLVRPADALLPHGYVMGRYERDGSQLYVNRGFGTAGPPIRLGTPPEVSRIVLTG